MAEGSVALQPTMTHEPSSWLLSGSQLSARESVHPENSGRFCKRSGGAEGELEARNSGIHSGGHAPTGCISTSVLSTRGFVMCELKAAEMTTATPMSASARKLEAAFLACGLR